MPKNRSLGLCTRRQGYNIGHVLSNVDNAMANVVDEAWRYGFD